MSLQDIVKNAVSQSQQSKSEKNAKSIEFLYHVLTQSLQSSLEEIKACSKEDLDKGQIELNLPECTPIIVAGESYADVTYIYDAGDEVWQFDKLSTLDINVAIAQSNKLFKIKKQQEFQAADDEALYQMTKGSDYAEVGADISSHIQKMKDAIANSAYKDLKNDVETYMTLSPEDEELLS
jgi:phospholipase/lecithinase/hemolysin